MYTSTQNNSFTEGKILDMWIEDGIIFCSYKASVIDLNTAQIATAERINYSKNRSYPTLIDYTRVKSTTKEARDYFASEEATQLFNAMAVLVESQIGKIMVNFYFKVSRPNLPTMLFNNREKAKQWLKQYV